MKLKDLANQTGTRIDRGDEDATISGAASLDLAGPADITFLANPRYTTQVASTKAGAIFIGEDVAIEREDLAILRARDPYVAYAMALRAFHPELPLRPGIDQTASIDSTSQISEGVEIGAFVSIGRDCVVEQGVRILPRVTIYDGVRIGSRTVIHSGVSIREDCVIGKNCVIQDNSTIGSDGFGYARTSEKRWLKIPQVGRVVLEDEVEVGANTAIDRSSVGECRVKRGTKIDNLVQIGHSCTIGEDSLICSQTGLAGSSEIGDRVILAGQVGIAGHLKVGDDATVTAKSATSHDVPDGAIVSGIPAFENKKWLRASAGFRRLGDVAKTLRNLKRRIRSLEKEVNNHE